MKELSVEQKAKAYDEALEKAKEFKNNPFAGYDGTDLISALFPELAESENERIRKALINQFSDYKRKGENHGFGYSNDKILAWLEKQAEQNPTLPKWKYKNDNTPLLRDSLILNKYGCVAKSPSGALVSDVWVIDYDELVKLPKEEFEKQGEQKPTEKVEPKFKVGDTMRTRKEAAYGLTGGMPVIISIDKEYYHCTNELISIKDQDEYEYPPMNRKQKPAWSEEDEKMLALSLNNLTELKDRFGEEYGRTGDCIEWLKSLKDRYTWKPSDAQMASITCAVRKMKESACYDSELVLLFNNLKKLRGEEI